MSAGESISLRVVQEVAAHEGIDPAELRPPLHAAIDTDALDALFRSVPSTDRAEGTVEFQYRGHTIRVDSSGAVRIGETITFTDPTEPRSQSADETTGD